MKWPRFLTAAAAALWLATLVAAGLGTWRLAQARPPLAGYAAPGGPAQDPLGPPAQRLTIVLAQGLTWSDLPHLPAGGDGWTAAALVTPPAGSRVEAGYLTIGAAAPAVAPELPVPPLDRDARWWDAEAGELHRRLTGVEPGGAAVVVPGLARLVHANRDRSPAATPGWLGEALARRGLRAAVLGEADFAGRHDGRWAPLLAMDAAGTVAYGRLEGMTRPDPEAPDGRVQDWPALVAAWESLPGDAALVVIDSGDLRRLEAAAPLLSPGRWTAARGEALDRLARGLAGLQAAAARRPGRDPIWVLAAAPAQSPAEAAFGVLWVWPDAAPAGETPAAPPGGLGRRAALLTSPSTRRWGVLALNDLAPSILAELGHDGGAPLGRAAAPGAPAYPWSRLGPAGAALERSLGANHTGRVQLIQGYVLLLIGTALAALAAVRWRGLGRAVAWTAPAMAAVPLAFLLLPGLGVEGVLLRAAVTIVLAAAAAVGAAAQPPARSFALIAGATIAAVLGDLLLGGPAAVRSPLGHSLLVGARYYGVGNEYGGVLIGAAAVAGGVLSGAGAGRSGGRPLLAGALVPATVGLLLLHPALGANFGCGLAALAAAGGFVVKALEGQPYRRPALSAAAAAAAAAVGLLLAVDLTQGVTASHIGRAAQQAAAGDWQALLEVARRKGLLNWRLIQYTTWSRVFVASLVAVTVLVLRPAAGLRRLSQREPGLSAGIVAAVIGAGAALVLNDSGVVAAATAMVLPTTMAACALLREGAGPAGPRSC